MIECGVYTVSFIAVSVQHCYKQSVFCGSLPAASSPVPGLRNALSAAPVFAAAPLGQTGCEQTPTHQASGYMPVHAATASGKSREVPSALAEAFSVSLLVMTRGHGSVCTILCSERCGLPFAMGTTELNTAAANAPQSIHLAPQSIPQMLLNAPPRPGHILVATRIGAQQTDTSARPPRAVRRFYHCVPNRANRCCQVCTFCKKDGCCLGASQGVPNSATCRKGRHICSTCYADHLFPRPQSA